MVACSAVLATVERCAAGAGVLSEEEELLLEVVTGRSGSELNGLGLVVGCVVGFHIVKVNPFVGDGVALPVADWETLGALYPADPSRILWKSGWPEEKPHGNGHDTRAQQLDDAVALPELCCLSASKTGIR